VYASKAFSCKAIFKIAQEKGACLDVVSGGEMYCAQQSGFDMKNVYFHGNNKSEEELRQALETGCGHIVLDNAMECERLVQLSDELGKGIEVLLRVNPGIEAHTHEYIQTSGSDSKFGLSIKEEEAINNIVKTHFILDIFNEANLISVENVKDDLFRVSVNPIGIKVCLERCGIYRKLRRTLRHDTDA
jgi:diaminopimelate decarboxylase